jgi:Spy/CpxP family protein refolding chaperone
VIVEKENAEMTSKMMVALSIAMTVAAVSPLANLAADQTKPAPATATTAPAGGHDHKSQFDDIKAVLRPDQGKQFDQIMQEARTNNEPMVQKLGELKKSGKESDPQFITLKQQLSERRRATKEKLMGILSPDQKAKVKQLRAERKASGADDSEKSKTN